MSRRGWQCDACGESYVEPVLACRRCGTTPTKLHWNVSVVERMSLFCRFFQMAPMGPHRKLIGELWPGATCPACEGTGLEPAVLLGPATECHACNGHAYRQPPGAISLGELRRRVRLAHPEAAPHDPSPWPLWEPGEDRRPRPALYARFAGALLGVACGDAMGLPVQGQSPSAALTHVNLLGQASHGDWRLFTEAYSGRYADEGRQARVLVEVLAAHGAVDADDFAARLTKTGARGSAARVVPLGVWYAHESDARIAAEAELQSRVTHAADRAAAAAIAVALAAADAARLPVARLRDRPVAWAALVEHLDPRLASGLRQLAQVPGTSRDEAGRWAAAHGPTVEPTPIGIPALAAPTVLFALWCWLRLPWRFSTSVLDAIAAGGHTNTTAAIVGGLVGAVTGVERLPHELTDRLEDESQWRRLALVFLCERAWRHHPSVQASSGASDGEDQTG